MWKTVALCAISLVMLVSASPAWSQQADVLFQLKDQMRGNCLIAIPVKSLNYTAVKSVPCDLNNKYSQWYWSSKGGGLANAQTHECLSATGIGTEYTLLPCTEANAQKQNVVRGSRFELMKGTSWCASVDRERVVVDRCRTEGSNRDHRWEYVFVASKNTFRIKHDYGKNCLAPTPDGTGLITEPCESGPENFRHIWYYEKAGVGHFLKNLATGKCVTWISDGKGGTSKGKLDTCGKTPPNQWVVQADAMFWFKNETMCLAAPHLHGNTVEIRKADIVKGTGMAQGKVWRFGCDNGDVYWKEIPISNEDITAHLSAVFQLKEQQFGNCLTVDHSRNVVSASCDIKSLDNRWYWSKVGGLVHERTGYCITASRMDDFYRIAECERVSADQGGLNRGSRFELSAGTKWCAVVDGNKRIQARPCKAEGRARNHLWEYVFVESKSTFRLKHDSGKRCLEANPDGTTMITEPCSDGAENFRQIWYYQKAGDKQYLKNLATGKCVTWVREGDDPLYSNPKLDTCGAAPSDQWATRKGTRLYFNWMCLTAPHKHGNSVGMRADRLDCTNGDVHWSKIPISNEYRTAVTWRYVKTIRPAEGLGGAAKFMAALAGGLLVESAFAAPEFVVGSNPIGGVAVMMFSTLTEPLKEALREKAMDLGESALMKIDEKFSGTDHLYITVNGDRVPTKGYQDARPGHKLDINRRYLLNQKVSLELWEHDAPFLLRWLSRSGFDDSMGGVWLDSGSSMEEYIAMLQGEDNSIYEVSYAIEAYIP